MKALFISTGSRDCLNHARAWESAFGPAEHVTFNLHGICNDWQLVEAVEKMRPDITLYIGAAKAPGLPRHPALRQMRAVAPLVNIVSDAADGPWWPMIGMYRTKGCFDLQVSIDGANNSPVDLVTLTPVDGRPFEGEQKRDIRCGFSGNIGRWNERSEVVRSLEWFGGLTLREGGKGYEDHVDFMKRCRIILNISFTGTGHAHHIKGRVLEAGWAGCALLESEGSPIAEWFPEGCWIPYDGPRHAKYLLDTLTDDEIDTAAANLAKAVRENYTAAQIYGRIIEGARRSVVPPLKTAAT